MWQEMIVGFIVLGAVLYLARRWLPLGKKSATAQDSGSCGGCGGCNTAKHCNNPAEKSPSRTH